MPDKKKTQNHYYNPSSQTWKPKRKSPTKGVRKAFDRDALKRICEMDEEDFFEEFDMQIVSVNQRYPSDYYLFKDHGSRVLFVGHLDTVVRPQQRKCGFLDTAGGPVVYSGGLDDRLGVFIGLDLLPALGIQYDILLTVGEEDGMSTAAFFDPEDVGIEEDRYDWIIEFDRGGTDVVMYQYDDRATDDLVRASGARTGNGSFSDIAYLEHLGRKAFNWGVGYRDYHGPRSHAYLDDTYQMVAHFLNFHEDNYGTTLRHEQKSSWWSGGSRWGGIWDQDDYAEANTTVIRTGGLGVGGEDPFPKEDAIGECAACGEDAYEYELQICVNCGEDDPAPKEDASPVGEACQTWFCQTCGFLVEGLFHENGVCLKVPEDVVSDDPETVSKALALLDERASEDPEAPIAPVDEVDRSMARRDDDGDLWIG
jgi:hypothetical protein